MFERIESSLAAIKSVLLNDEIVRKLVYNDSNNALNIAAPNPDEANKYITLRPIYQFENMADFSQNGMVNIFFDNGSPAVDDNALTGVIQVNVVFNIDKWELVNNKIRPIVLSDRIIKLLDGRKFTISNPLEFNSIQQLIISKQLVGYALLFDIVDGSGDID